MAKEIKYSKRAGIEAKLMLAQISVTFTMYRTSKLSATSGKVAPRLKIDGRKRIATATNEMVVSKLVA